jgi:hypothetical protein
MGDDCLGIKQGMKCSEWARQPWRGPDANSTTAVAANRAVQREREALPHYLSGAYGDSRAAKAHLDEMVKCQGWTSTAVRIARDPTQLGEFRGKTGMFAESRVKAERAMAEQAAGAVAPSPERIGAAEAKAAQTYRASVDAQRKADATPIPKLTVRVQAAADEKAQAAPWRGITANQTIGPEPRQFSAAEQQRFGDDTARAMLRSRGGSVEAASVSRTHQAAFATVSRTVHILKSGKHSGARQADAARLAQRQALGYRTGLKPYKASRMPPAGNDGPSVS